MSDKNIPLVGSLGDVLTLRVKEDRPRLSLRRSKKEPLRGNANALILFRRLAPKHEDQAEEDQKSQKYQKDQKSLVDAIHSWAVDKWKPASGGLYDSVIRRREEFLRRWGSGGTAVSLRLEIEWRLTTGLGLRYGIMDSGIALHGTYGWPVIPASTVKGLARVGGETTDEETVVDRLLGGAHDEAAPGSVTFLDAFPDDGFTVHRDVITPHQQPYYTDSHHATAPGEHHNPVPLHFLSLSGSMRIDVLTQNDDDVERIIDWLNKAGDLTGMGGRVTAGYGYFSVKRAQNGSSSDSED